MGTAAMRDGDELPDWLCEELAGLERDFGHVPGGARGAALLPHLSVRGWAYLDARMARVFAAGLAHGAAEEAF